MVPLTSRMFISTFSIASWVWSILSLAYGIIVQWVNQTKIPSASEHYLNGQSLLPKKSNHWLLFPNDTSMTPPYFFFPLQKAGWVRMHRSGSKKQESRLCHNSLPGKRTHCFFPLARVVFWRSVTAHWIVCYLRSIPQQNKLWNHGKKKHRKILKL